MRETGYNIPCERFRITRKNLALWQRRCRHRLKLGDDVIAAGGAVVALHVNYWVRIVRKSRRKRRASAGALFWGTLPPLSAELVEVG